MSDHIDLDTVLAFLDTFAVEFSSLCGGLRLAAQHLPSPSPGCREERDATDLLNLMVTGLEQQEQNLGDRLSTFMRSNDKKEER